MVIGLQNEREWEAFCQSVLKRPELAADERFKGNNRRNRNRAPLLQIMNAELGPLDLDALIGRLEQARIAYGRMNSMVDLFHHEQLSDRQRWIEIGSPAGAVDVLRPPVEVSGTGVTMGAIPAVGEHSVQILSSLGYDPAEIERLVKAEVF